MSHSSTKEQEWGPRSPRFQWLVGSGSSLAAAGWMGLIFYSSSLTGVESSRHLDAASVSWLGDTRSYAGHVLLYAVLAGLLQTALWGWKRGPDLRWVISVVVFSSLFAISDEYHQTFVSGRSATAADVVVDIAAATATASILWALISVKPWRSRHR